MVVVGIYLGIEAVGIEVLHITGIRVYVVYLLMTYAYSCVVRV